MGHIGGGAAAGGSETLKTFQLLDQMVAILDTGGYDFFLWPFLETTGAVTHTYGSTVRQLTAIDSGTGGLQPYIHPGGAGSLHLDGTYNQHLYSADYSLFSFGNGTTDGALSVGLWIMPEAVGTTTLICKWASAAQEWNLHIGGASNNIKLGLYDDSASASEIATGDTNLLTAHVNIWSFIVATYDGDEADPTVNLYLNAVLDNDGTTDETNAYVAMENTTAEMLMGAIGPSTAPGNELNGRLALPFICGKELTAANVVTLRGLGQTLLGV